MEVRLLWQMLAPHREALRAMPGKVKRIHRSIYMLMLS